MKLVNPHTGEVLEGLAVPRQKRYPQGKEFMTMFRDGWEYLSEIDDLAGRDYRVLHRLLSKLDYENWISVSQETIAEELNLRQPDVNKSIGRLTGHRIIEREKDPIDKRRWRYRLNANLGWKGDARQWRQHQEARHRHFSLNGHNGDATISNN